jgi:hypothetical protein
MDRLQGPLKIAAACTLQVSSFFDPSFHETLLISLLFFSLDAVFCIRSC